MGEKKLSKLGKEQAAYAGQKIAESLCELPAQTKVVLKSSTMPRAKETMEIISRYLPKHDPIVYDDLLKEKGVFILQPGATAEHVKKFKDVEKNMAAMAEQFEKHYSRSTEISTPSDEYEVEIV